jgi:hypothetical protein
LRGEPVHAAAADPAPDPQNKTPLVLGVDALRKGHVYGTVLVDIESRRPVDVLPERSAESFRSWLDDHPGVEIICRDRGGCYAEGAAEGAPLATQVADRWHLRHNLAEAAERAVASHRSCLPEPPLQPEPEPPAEEAEPLPQTGLAARTRARHAEIHALVGFVRENQPQLFVTGDRTPRLGGVDVRQL